MRIISFLNFEFIVSLAGVRLSHISWVMFIDFDIPILISTSSAQLKRGDDAISFKKSFSLNFQNER